MFRSPLSGVQHAKFPTLFLTDGSLKYDVPKPTKESGVLQSFSSLLARNPRRARAVIGPLTDSLLLTLNPS